jgi:L-malate glycosyltransferase
MSIIATLEDNNTSTLIARTDRACASQNALVVASRPLRIVHLVSSLKVGGMEHFVLRIAQAQRAAGHAVSVMALQPGPLLDEAKRLGIPACVLGGTNRAVRAAKGACRLALLRPDILHAHNQTSLHYAALGKRVSRARVVMTNHGQGLGSARTPGAAEWRGTDAIVAVSNAVAGRMDTELLGAKITTVHNGVTFAEARRSRCDVRAELAIPEGRITGIIVARMDGMKGHDALLNALASLRRANVPLTMLIAGDGVEHGSMEKLAAQLGLGRSDVRFLGFRTDVPDLLAASDFFVLPSLTEGFPLSVLEAMSHGLPTVATDVGGIPELVTHGEHGLLVPVKSPDALADAMQALVEDADLRSRLGAAARKRVTEEFSFDEMARKYERLYYSLCRAVEK